MFKWFVKLFYADPFERKVDRFFKSLRSGASGVSVRRGLLKLMRSDLVILNVWMELKFRGYKRFVEEEEEEDL